MTETTTNIWDQQHTRCIYSVCYGDQTGETRGVTQTKYYLCRDGFRGACSVHMYSV